MKAARSTILTKSLAIMLVGVMIGGQSAPDGWTYESATRGENQSFIQVIPVEKNIVDEDNPQTPGSGRRSVAPPEVARGEFLGEGPF